MRPQLAHPRPHNNTRFATAAALQQQQPNWYFHRQLTARAQPPQRPLHLQEPPPEEDPTSRTGYNLSTPDCSSNSVATAIKARTPALMLPPSVLRFGGTWKLVSTGLGSSLRGVKAAPLVRASSAREASFSFPWTNSPEKMTMRPIPANSLYVSTPTWWLESRFHFSFAEYYNPENAEFGVLRVLNDDLVKPKSGFGTHAHRDMEIFTYVVDGSLTHKDSIGTSESLGRGAVQYMSAGTGIRHSEMNNNDALLRFLQIWIQPERRGLKPNYGSRVFKKEDRHNKIQHVVTDFKKYQSESDLGVGVIPIHQDVNIYVSEADPGVDQDFVLSQGRQAYLVCIEGKLSVTDLVHLDTRDAVEIRAGASEDLALKLKADKDAGAHFLMIEMALA